jgi:hypothetical protein
MTKMILMKPIRLREWLFRTGNKMTPDNTAMHKKTSAPTKPGPRRKPLLVDLALQGGGAHGAFTWGVLDRLLQEPALVQYDYRDNRLNMISYLWLSTGSCGAGWAWVRLRS